MYRLLNGQCTKDSVNFPCIADAIAAGYILNMLPNCNCEYILTERENDNFSILRFEDTKNIERQLSSIELNFIKNKLNVLIKDEDQITRDRLSDLFPLIVSIVKNIHGSTSIYEVFKPSGILHKRLLSSLFNE